MSLVRMRQAIEENDMKTFYESADILLESDNYDFRMYGAEDVAKLRRLCDLTDNSQKMHELEELINAYKTYITDLLVSKSSRE